MSRIHLVAVVAVLTAWMSGAATAAESPSVPQRVGHAIERAGEAAAHGVKRGAEATSHGVEVGLKATEDGLARGGEAIEHAAHKVTQKVRSASQK